MSDDEIPDPPPYEEEHLESNLFLGHLNQFVSQITNLYSLVFDKVQFKRMKERKNLIPVRSWIELFIRMERDKDTRNEVIQCLNECGLDENDLKCLQKLRRVRNDLCHPRTNLQVAEEMLGDFKNHSCCPSITKAITFLKTQELSLKKNKKKDT
jgi:dTDP-4-amino-4,6-dideoxygalactose transaminase